MVNASLQSIINSNTNSTPFSFLTNHNISQVAYSVNIIDPQNRTLIEAVREHLKVSQSNFTAFHIYDDSANFRITKESPVYQMAYTFTGGLYDPCKKCVGLDFLAMMDDKLYLISYHGDVEKIEDFIPTI